MNTFGQIFRVHIFGESHGSYTGTTIDGCRPGLEISIEDFFADINRRKSGAKGTTARIEDDIPEIISGIYNGKCTGAPLTIIFKSNNTKSQDYQTFKEMPRPGHADFTANKKYNGFNDFRGGGHFSGRLTLPLVAAGVIAKKMLNSIQINAKLTEAFGIKNIDVAIDKAIEMNDSIGGIVNCKATNLPIGLGEPFFNSVESLISHAVFSIPGIKGIEFGAGFEAAKMKGSEHNDSIISKEGKTQTNFSGGINGGITNGNNLEFRVAVKPTSSTPQSQKTINLSTNKIEDFVVTGRHDLCIALRVPVIVEAVTAIVLNDLLLLK